MEIAYSINNVINYDVLETVEKPDCMVRRNQGLLKATNSENLVKQCLLLTSGIIKLYSTR